MNFYTELLERDGVSSLAWFGDRVDHTNPDTSPITFTGLTRQWTNWGASRDVLIRLDVGVGLAASGQVDIAISATGGSSRGCAKPSSKRGVGLASVGDAEDPVNTFTGAYTESRVDLVATAGVFGMEWGREYDSGGTAGDASWGYSGASELSGV